MSRSPIRCDVTAIYGRDDRSQQSSDAGHHPVVIVPASIQTPVAPANWNCSVPEPVAPWYAPVLSVPSTVEVRWKKNGLPKLVSDVGALREFPGAHTVPLESSAIVPLPSRTSIVSERWSWKQLVLGIGVNSSSSIVICTAPSPCSVPAPQIPGPEHGNGG